MSDLITAPRLGVTFCWVARPFDPQERATQFVALRDEKRQLERKDLHDCGGNSVTSSDHDFGSFTLGKGRHKVREDGMSFMEAVAYISGEHHTDHPRCACPAITEFCILWNDRIDDDAERTKWLAPYLYRIPGTRILKETELQRRELLFDWAFREQLPRALELLSELKPYARAFRDLPPLTAANSAGVFPIMRDAHNHTAAMVVTWATAWGRTLRMALEVGGKALEPSVWDVACERWKILRRQFMDYFVESQDEDVQALGIQVSRAAKSLLANDHQLASQLLDRMIQLTRTFWEESKL